MIHRTDRGGHVEDFLRRETPQPPVLRESFTHRDHLIQSGARDVGWLKVPQVLLCPHLLRTSPHQFRVMMPSSFFGRQSSSFFPPRPAELTQGPFALLTN